MIHHFVRRKPVPKQRHFPAQAYDRLLESKRDFQRYGFTLISLGLVCAIVGTWVPDVRYPGFMLFVLGLYSSSLANFQHRLSVMQAQLDMLRVAKGQEPA